VDDTLRAIVARAVARDPRQRYDGAASFRDALSAWLTPADGAVAGDGGHDTVEFLLRRMKHKRDFPALGESIVRIQRVASSETESLASLSAEILKDVALTNKLLRMVNTVHFAKAGAGSISTISRAVALVGFAGIRNMALSVVLLDHMQDREHAAQIREEFLRGLMAGTLAAELSPTPREAEETFIGAMFQNLGRMLTQYYFPEEAQRIRQDASGAGMAAEDKAAVKVLGLSYQALGVGVARAWGLPDSLQRMMAQPDGDPPAKPVDKGPERQRWIGRIANEITDTMLGDDVARVDERIGRLAEHFAPALGLPRRAVLSAAEAARERLTALADALGLHVTPDAPASRLMRAPQEATTDTLAPHQLAATAHAPLEDARTLVLDDAPAAPAGPPRAELLAAGVQDITNSMVADNFKLNEVLRMVLETMYRALDFQRVVFCLRDPKTETLTGRFGLGSELDAVKAAFRVPLKPKGAPDLFSAICGKGMDTLIADATVPTVAQRLPAWYRESVNAPTFLLLPMVLKGTTFALIYADKGRAGGIEVDEKELSLLRTLRNQAVMAFRQLGH
jgi:HD-like signal output (HDOD) protein